MDEDRPQKKTMRRLWIQQIYKSARELWTGSAPLYLTLSGASGRDIELIIKKGIMKRNEVGGIATEDLEKVVAVESSMSAVLQLQKRFPGLKILDHPFQNLVRSANPIRWPEGRDEEYCRAHIINLDLNEPLLSQIAGGQVSFPVLQWIQKLAQIHATAPHFGWFLFLTLHGEITWERQTNNSVQAFLVENFQRESEFASACQTLLGNSLFERISSNEIMSFNELSPVDQQKVLMTFVPKKIAQLVVSQGWCVITSRNLRYGGGARAPIVSWIIHFVWDARVSSTPNAVYLESLKSVLARSGHIEENGRLS